MLDDDVVTDQVGSILLKKSGPPVDASESKKCSRGEAPQAIFRWTKIKATHSPRRWRLEKLLEIRRPDFFNSIGRERPIHRPTTMSDHIALRQAGIGQFRSFESVLNAALF